MYYNTDKRMVPLMERIVWQLCERVDQIIDVHTLFKYVQIHVNFTLEGSDFSKNLVRVLELNSLFFGFS